MDGTEVPNTGYMRPSNLYQSCGFTLSYSVTICGYMVDWRTLATARTVGNKCQVTNFKLMFRANPFSLSWNIRNNVIYTSHQRTRMALGSYVGCIY